MDPLRWTSGYGPRTKTPHGASPPPKTYDDATRPARTLDRPLDRVRKAMGVVLAEAGSPSGRRWKPLDVAVSAAVDTARSSPLTSRHGDSDDPGFRASANGLAR